MTLIVTNLLKDLLVLVEFRTKVKLQRATLRLGTNLNISYKENIAFLHTVKTTSAP